MRAAPGRRAERSAKRGASRGADRRAAEHPEQTHSGCGGKRARRAEREILVAAGHTESPCQFRAERALRPRVERAGEGFPCILAIVQATAAQVKLSSSRRITPSLVPVLMAEFTIPRGEDASICFCELDIIIAASLFRRT